MKKFSVTLLCILTVIIVCLSTDFVSASSGTCTEYSGTNVNLQNYENCADVISSYLVSLSDGTLMKVQGNSSAEGIVVEYYNSSYQLISSKLVAAELPIFGGFYSDGSNYYVVTGQINYSELASVEVFRITKYDTNWNKITSCGLYDCNTTFPFYAGSLRFDKCGNYLLIRTAHEMYTSSDGYNHQANVTIQVDTNTMTITDSYTQVTNSSYGYASHSFNQFIRVENNNIIAVDHGDAYPRSIALFKYNTDVTTGKFTPSYYTSCDVVDVMDLYGSIGDNYTGATIGGFEISSDNYIIAGNSVPQESENFGLTTKNVFVASVSKSDYSVNINWVTSFDEGETTTTTPHLVDLGNDSFMLMWSRGYKVYYTLIDGNGNRIGSIYSMTASLSDCQPVLYNNNLIWYTYTNKKTTFYEISLSNLSQTNSTTTQTGHSYLNQGVSNGVASLYCNTCGYSTTLEVPTSMTLYWNETPDILSYYTTEINTNQTAGTTIEAWPIFDISGDIVVLDIAVSDSSIAYVEQLTNRSLYNIHFKKGGNVTITFSVAYNPSISKSYTFTVEGDAAAEEYIGNVNSELLKFTYNEETNYISGEIVVVEWVNNESTVPSVPPVITFDSADGTESIEVFVTATGTNTYYFDRLLANGLTEGKEYVFTVTSGNPNNVSTYRSVPIYTGTSSIGSQGQLGTVGTQRIMYTTDASTGYLLVYGKPDTYEGQINSVLTGVTCVKSENGSNFVSGNVVIVEWIDGVSNVPSTTPEMTFESVDGTEVLPIYIASIDGTNTYYFDRNLNEDMDVTKEYIFKITLTDPRNISPLKTMVATTNYLDKKEGMLWETDTQYIMYKSVWADNDNQLRIYAVNK